MKCRECIQLGHEDCPRWKEDPPVHATEHVACAPMAELERLKERIKSALDWVNIIEEDAVVRLLLSNSAKIDPLQELHALRAVLEGANQ